MLQLNKLFPQPGSRTSRKRLGRGQGSGLGQTAGKGDKGQLARTGGVSRPGFEGGQTPLYRKLPKRGFTNPGRRFKAIINLADVAEAGLTDVSLETLSQAGLVKGTYDRLSVLGNGELKKAINVKAHKVSASAQEKIQKAGGSIELIPIPQGVKRKREKKNKQKKS